MRVQTRSKVKVRVWLGSGFGSVKRLHHQSLSLCYRMLLAACPCLHLQPPQDITPPERLQRDPTCDREVAVYGYLRGCNMKRNMRVHLAGVGDYTVRVSSWTL